MGEPAPDDRWLDICDTGDVFEGTGRRYQIEGLPPLAVFNVDGQFHVTDDTCTHGDASLTDGWLDGDQVECPFHAGRFCVRNGEPTAYPAEVPLKVYPCRIEGGRVLIDRG